jgi:nitrite reductase/ring-hydroxylating ferredoxin subunit/uncharacterized membrane protein
VAEIKHEELSTAQRRKLGARILTGISRQTWLDRPSYRFEHLLAVCYNSLGSARDRITNVLHGVWLGHPVHPPLASLTTGAIGTSVALDALSLMPGRSKTQRLEASRLASQALWLGIVANIGSAATGVTDWQHTHGSARRIGAVHGLLNLGATGLYAKSWLTRRHGRRGRGIALSAAAYAITMGSSYLGGALVFDAGIGIDRSGGRLFTSDWTPELPLSALHDGKPKRVQVNGVGLVVCRTGNDQVAAFGELCPHLAAPMADGWVDRGRIVCPWHGSRFKIETGEVSRGPAAAPLPCYQARINDGTIELRGHDPRGPTIEMLK